eukprot:3309977-Rhodomonas_salina.1
MNATTQTHTQSLTHAHSTLSRASMRMLAAFTSPCTTCPWRRRQKRTRQKRRREGVRVEESGARVLVLGTLD